MNRQEPRGMVERVMNEGKVEMNKVFFLNKHLPVLRRCNKDRK